MKKITLKQYGRSVSATFPDEADLDEALEIVGGLLGTLGYRWDGQLGIVETEG